MWTDLRLAFRQCRTHRGFACATICTLALTTGASIAVLAVVIGVLLRALPFDRPERLVWLASVRADNQNAPFSLPEYLDYRHVNRTLSGLAAYAYWTASVAGNAVTERLQGARMSGHAFDVLGIAPAAGRLLTEADDRAEAPPVVVISHRLWRRLYGARPDIAGTPVRINGEPFVIVGVLPAQFPLPLRDIDVVTPLAPDRDPLRHVRNSVNFLRLFARLKPGVDASQAQAELTDICDSLRQRFPVEYARKEAVRVVALHEVLVGDVRTTLFVVLAAVVVVFAVALANLVSLAMVRGAARRGELTVRAALGASRARLVRQLLAETSVMSVAGSALGWLLGGLMIAAAVRWAPPSVPRLAEVNLDGSLAVTVVAVTIVVAILLAVAPLGMALSGHASEAFRSSHRGAIGHDRWSRRLRNLLVVAQIAAALVLLLITAGLTRHLRQLHREHPGFDPDGVFQARISIPDAYRSRDDVSRFYELLAERLAASPGVTHVGVISIAPLSGLLRTVPFTAGGQPDGERDRVMANLRIISPEYIAAVETRLLRGRLFSENDRSDTPHVALVSAALADRFFSGDAVGQWLRVNDNAQGPRPVAIVGIVENVRHTALDVAAELDIYMPLRQMLPGGVAFVRSNQFWMVRTAADPAAFRQTFLTHVRAVDPDVAVSDAGPMQQSIDAWLGPRRFTLALFSAFASVTVLIAFVGIYGLVSFAVSQRTTEISLRMALGATPRGVRRMIVRGAAHMGLAGVCVGLVVSVGLRRVMAGLVPDVGVDASLAGVSAGVLIGVILLAAWWPAARAARTDPNSGLRV
jgi:putative ABC transport system permease protein